MTIKICRNIPKIGPSPFPQGRLWTIEVTCRGPRLRWKLHPRLHPPVPYSLPTQISALCTFLLKMWSGDGG